MTSLTSTSTAALNQPPSSSANPGFTVPLSRVDKPSVLTETSRLFSTTSGKQELENSNEYAYILTISVGEQVFEVIFDTGSSDLWIVTTACTDTDCTGVNRYEPSPTLQLSSIPFDLGYLTGNVSGSIGFEEVLFGPFVIFSQVLALANTTSNMGLSATGVSGVLGLAFPSDAAISSTLGRTLLENVFAHLDPADRFFSYKLSAVGNDSTFSIGEIDPAYADQASDIFYSPVYSSDGADYDYWKLPLQAITVNGAAIPFALSPSKVSGATSPIAVLDTGTTLILGPTHDVDNFWTVVGGAQKGDDGRWVVRCNHVISVGLVLGNDTVHREIPLDPSDVSWWPPGSSSDGWCLGGIQSNDGVFSGDWLFGDVFLRSVYVVHQADTSTSSPLIGLLSTTNASQAAAQFQNARGADPTPVAYAGQALHSTHRLSLGVTLALALIAGFLGGVVFAIVFRIQREKRRRRRKMANLIQSKS